jgi:hypothetical protein
MVDVRCCETCGHVQGGGNHRQLVTLPGSRPPSKFAHRNPSIEIRSSKSIDRNSSRGFRRTPFLRMMQLTADAEDSTPDWEELRDDLRCILYVNGLWEDLGIADPEGIAQYLAQRSSEELEEMAAYLDESLPVPSVSDKESVGESFDVASSSSGEPEYSSEGGHPYFDDGGFGPTRPSTMKAPHRP